MGISGSDLLEVPTIFLRPIFEAYIRAMFLCFKDPCQLRHSVQLRQRVHRSPYDFIVERTSSMLLPCSTVISMRSSHRFRQRSKYIYIYYT